MIFLIGSDIISGLDWKSLADNSVSDASVRTDSGLFSPCSFIDGDHNRYWVRAAELEDAT